MAWAPPTQVVPNSSFLESILTPSKDYLKYNGVEVSLPRDVIKQGFHHKIIQDGQTWIEMLEDRNLMAYVYREETAQAVMTNIQKKYIAAIDQVFHFLKEKQST